MRVLVQVCGHARAQMRVSHASTSRIRDSLGVGHMGVYLVEAKLRTGWVARADVVVDGVANARHVRRLGQVITTAA